MFDREVLKYFLIDEENNNMKVLAYEPICTNVYQSEIIMHNLNRVVIDKNDGINIHQKR